MENKLLWMDRHRHGFLSTVAAHGFGRMAYILL